MRARGDLGAHGQAGRASLEMSPCAWSRVGGGERTGPEAKKLTRDEPQKERRD